MQTSFTKEQLEDADLAVSEKILRSCVHCGFCTATCPTYVLEGDELDSPRGRIYLIKEMFEQGRPASAEIVTHIDRCLSCLACMTTCPSGVNYMHLVDHARAHIEETYGRPLGDRLIRMMLAAILPYPHRFSSVLRVASLLKPLANFLPRPGRGRKTPSLFDRLAAMAELAPRKLPRRDCEQARVFAPRGERRGRVALLAGCAQQVLNPAINAAAIRLLTRNGIEVVLADDETCCGALVHHLGRKGQALGFARANIDAWSRAHVDAILVTASGCGTTVKDYGFMLRDDPLYAEKAAEISGRARDISEYLAELDLQPRSPKPFTVAYHAACSLQHGQQITDLPKRLLKAAGFSVRDVPEGHICCGSAGTYNILQPFFANRLKRRKLANIEKLRPDLIAAGNIGCMTQLAGGTEIPILHTVELLDWADGGPMPLQIAKRGA
ncbi:MAG TPA: glycolate oxidase subunit GlcF [Methylovirgula sp.]|nr:glycolate oxidase subunit GlcF [Methylovirgula sp.]